MNIDPFNLGFITGLFEGEGSCSSYVPRKRKFTKRQVIIVSTDKEPLEKVVSIVGFGKVYGPYVNTSGYGRKLKYQYTIHKSTQVEEFLTAIYPHLCPRRQEQIIACLGDDFYYEVENALPG